MDPSQETATQRWAKHLREWALPEEILQAAPLHPFVFKPEMFAAPEPGTFEPSLSNRRAAEALSNDGTVLDVGCGGGAAAFAVTPPATAVIGTDRQPDMVALFAETARQRGINASTHAGPWPQIADEVPAADVVVCHNVLYNIADIGPFVAALNDHARRRVVIEITHKHPHDGRRALWRHFWNLERPYGPTAEVAAAAIAEAGVDPVVEEHVLGPDPREQTRNALQASQWCRMLCLGPEREPEVESMMGDIRFPRERVTIWWDTQN